MTSEKLIKNITAMFKGQVTIKETEIGCFELKANSPWMLPNMVITASQDFMDFLSAKMFKEGKIVHWNNAKNIFWFEDFKK